MYWITQKLNWIAWTLYSNKWLFSSKSLTSSQTHTRHYFGWTGEQRPQLSPPSFYSHTQQQHNQIRLSVCPLSPLSRRECGGSLIRLYSWGVLTSRFAQAHWGLNFRNWLGSGTEQLLVRNPVFVRVPKIWHASISSANIVTKISRVVLLCSEPIIFLLGANISVNLRHKIFIGSAPA